MGSGTRTLAGALACVAALAAASPAAAEVGSVLDGAVRCQAEADGTRFCGGPDALAPTFDGQPIDVNVALPPAPEAGSDGPYPLVMVFHGYGGSKFGLDRLRHWTEQGYAAFSMSDRGFGPCGAKPLPPSRCLDGGWVRLMDTRYEVRDAQHFAGQLVDDGVVDPGRIAATGGSYGGGMSMALAALRDRMMMTDGSLAPWESPGGTPISLAAAAPEIPWTDLAYSLMPNGRTLDYVADAPYRGRVGVMKQSFVSGLFASGAATGFYAPPGADPEADLTTWFGLINAGEPYDENPMITGILDRITTYHSSYYIDDSVEPAPLLISNGWTDDIFPADEALRFYNRTRTEYPGADISLIFFDHGHQRGQNKAADAALLDQRQDEFLAHHLAGARAPDEPRITTLTQTCPRSEPSGGPFTAPTWAAMAPGEVRGTFAAAQTIAPAVPSDLTRGQAYDPITGGGACQTAPGDDQAGAASYRLPAAAGDGYTLMGSPTVIADFSLATPTSQVAARLLDVAPNGDATLIARGLWRPATGGTTREVFQLHANGWRFAPGHTAKLELLPADVPYGRHSNLQGSITVSNLELRLPVVERPGAAEGAVRDPAPKVVPAGYELAREFRGVSSRPLPRCRGRGATQLATAGHRARGSRGDDVIVGTPRADRIRAGRGADLVCGGRGGDRIRGGRGDDELWGGAGRDDLRGGRGSDRLDGRPERRR